MSLFKGIKIWDTITSAYLGLAFRDGAPQICAQDYLDALAEGDIPNHATWNKIGFRDASTSGVEVAVSPQLSATEYIFPTSAQHMHVVSSSIEDDPAVIVTGAVGTGAHTITIYYLDGSYNEKSTLVTLNGQGVVSTADGTPAATDIFRIQNVRVTTVGTGYASAGNITIKNHAETETYGYIRAGKTRQRQMIWTVPLGKTLYVTQITFTASNMGSTKYARFTTKATYDDKSATVLAAGLFFMPFTEAGLMNDIYVRDLKPPTKLPATVDIKVTCATNDTGAVLTCGLRGWTE
jgi:hypothetical protein